VEDIVEQEVFVAAHRASDVTTRGPAFQARILLYLQILLAITAFLHLVVLTARLMFGDDPLRAVLFDADALRRLAVVLGCAALTVLVWRRRLSREALLSVDALSALLLSGAMLLGIPLRSPELRPELSALLTVNLILVGRAAIVPSSARRTLAIGLLALGPLLVLAPLFFPSDHLIAGIPHRRLVRVTIFGFGIATLAITTVTSHLTYRLRRSMANAMTLGPYEIVRKLGEGGMGAVYEARHALLRRRTALKLIKADGDEISSEARFERQARFEREARLTSELSHPNTVALYDYGQTIDGIDYYAMELVDGLTLHDLVRREGPLPPGRALGLLRQVAASLAEAHGKGLIHRDIKPSNVMVCHRDENSDCVKVLDFGLATRLRGPGEARSNQAEPRVGTPEFMAPEAVYDPRKVGTPADVYAVGALGYFLITGAAPFEGTDVRAIARSHLREPPLPPSLRTDQEIPLDLEGVLMACLKKDPEHRYPDGRSLLRAFEACAGDPSWSMEEADRWWRAWTSGAASPPRVLQRACPEPTRRELAPVSTRPFVLRPR
jgi:serine/threonine-protein kinase